MTDEKKITMTADSGESVDFYVLEETRIGGTDYLLVTDEMDEEDGECYILKDLSGAEDDQAVYEFVENDEELDYLYRIFSELLNDADVEIEK
ncbi:MAG TPA: DUF1292 domain-containing protein [Candidatus Lachnoclostridium stercoravium]|uniref:DUF1292 domain-containing protein n=1 Tax=Candidatus Lachnoclostridium stercoravium TaxID=2838633 RepID=A0A9D2KP04_9FIRM|nr:DUF1292 domain-containing protein [Candidatus Lachnoclostridium stercoravium]